jgi:cell fate regulator YaaT (PSP1 superfamily)
VETTEKTPSRLIVAVRFAPVGKLYHFDATAHPATRPGDHVVVETTRGSQVGEVVGIVEPGSSAARDAEGGLKAIDRMATPRELAMQQCWKAKEAEAVARGRERALQLDLREVKIVRAEFSYDGARLTYLVSTPDENGRLEVKSLREDMQAVFLDSQVSVRQIGPRDAAKLIGGMGACGLEARCCCRFLIDFNPVSIKMAKEQSISLNPEEITGMCGRLRCCMAYEFEQYAEARKTLPKRNKQVMTPKGPGKVVEVNALKETVFVEIRDGEDTRVIEVARGDFELLAPAPGPEAPLAEAPKKSEKAPGDGQPRPAQSGEGHGDGRRARRARGERRDGAEKRRAG